MLRWLLLLCFCSLGVSQAVLYPFGPSAGDSSLRNGDDEFTNPPISLTTGSFPFFSARPTSLYINTNGIISLDIVYNRQFNPVLFPLTASDGGSINLIAPFWGDVDTSQRGNVYYRNASTDVPLLERAQRELVMYFDSATDFQPNFLFIATWSGVSYFGGSETSLTNTFQCILVSNGSTSFIMFRYDSIEWTIARFGSHAVVGYNGPAGNYFVVPTSNTADIRNINSTSNVNVTGVWAFRVAFEDQTTPVPTTQEQTTLIPTTKEETTLVPTTEEQTTLVPTTEEQTTLVPTTEEQTTLVPMTEEQTTLVPTTEERTTMIPTTEEQTTLIPTTEEETTLVPTTEEQTTLVPTTEEQTTVVPTTEEQTTLVPTTEEQTTVVPTTEEQTTLVPTTEEQTILVPMTEEPTTAQGSGMGVVPDCTCQRMIECSIFGEFTNENGIAAVPNSRDLRCVIGSTDMAPEQMVGQIGGEAALMMPMGSGSGMAMMTAQDPTLFIDRTFDTGTISPGSFVFLRDIGFVSRSEGISQCTIVRSSESDSNLLSSFLNLRQVTIVYENALGQYRSTLVNTNQLDQVPVQDLDEFQQCALTKIVMAVNSSYSQQQYFCRDRDASTSREETLITFMVSCS